MAPGATGVTGASRGFETIPGPSRAAGTARATEAFGTRPGTFGTVTEAFGTAMATGRPRGVRAQPG